MLTALMRRFARDDRGVSALEFAFLTPVMLVLLLVGVDTTRYIRETRRVETVASTIGQMISVNQSGSVNYVDLQFFHDSAMVIFPEVLADSSQQQITWSNDISISMASFQFTPSPSCASCSPTPKLVWAGGSKPRSCTTMPTPVADTASPSSSTLPTDAFTTGTLIVIDVSFNFRPTIAPQFMKTLSVSRSYYVAPRYVPSITYAVISGDNGIAKSC